MSSNHPGLDLKQILNCFKSDNMVCVGGGGEVIIYLQVYPYFAHMTNVTCRVMFVIDPKTNCNLEYIYLTL